MSHEQQQREAELVRQRTVITFRDANGNHVEIDIPPASDAAPGELQMANMITSHMTSDPDETGFVTTWETVFLVPEPLKG